MISFDLLETWSLVKWLRASAWSNADQDQTKQRFVSVRLERIKIVRTTKRPLFLQLFDDPESSNPTNKQDRILHINTDAQKQ